MPIEMRTDATTNLVEVNLSGKLHADDYKAFVPKIEAAIEEHGKLRMLVRMEKFSGWDAGALWQDIKFDVKHFADFEKIAIVGDSKWEEGIAKFCEPFTSASVEFFEEGTESAASQWLCKVA